MITAQTALLNPREAALTLELQLQRQLDRARAADLI